MLPSNTFLIRQNERVISEGAFISILSPQLLGILNESYFERTVFINSTPGGGKSTLLKTFSPRILLELKENNTKEMYRDTFELLNHWGIIDEKSVNLTSVKIECARENYSLIDDLYDNGKAVAVFFELLSLRILRRTLSGILVCNQLEENMLEHITFNYVPDEWKMLLYKYSTGKDIYQWSLKREHELCNSIEEMNTDLIASMTYNNLSVLRLVGNGNILLSGKPVKQKVLIMFDDVHALSYKQRKILREMIFRLRPNLGVWISQRMVALSNKDIFGTDGHIHREYEIINIDENIQKNKKGFYKALKDVSDRRAAMTYKDEYLEDKFEKNLSKNTEKKLDGVLKKIKHQVELLCKNNENYSNICAYLETKEYKDKWEKVMLWQVLHILIERDRKKNQLFLPFVNIYSINGFLEEYEKLRKSIEYFICYKYKLPIYYGMNALQTLSSCNVEQFLDFAGMLFELRIALDYVSRKRRKALISQEEQENVIVKCAEEKWADILRTYSMGLQIQQFISRIAHLGIEHLEQNTISYSGGTYTGIGIRKSELDDLLYDDEDELVKMLKMCVVNNLLSCQEIKQGQIGMVYKVFYLNRWICVKFRLPLGYGGWRPLSIKAAKNLLDIEDER